ncbi:MAG: thiamine pyrophosphate-dependent enzyme [Thermoplasmatota archaeon]
MPSTFCPGCGCGMVLSCFARAVDHQRINPREILMVTGIGCSSWIPSPLFNCDTLHTTHGRALAFATGAKMASPRTRVLTIAGDGDLAGIGGNHLLHAAHRNIDLGVMMVNNRIYGMTGGQVSPTTLLGGRTATTPYGSIERPMPVAELVAAAGANYVARWTTYHVRQLTGAMEELLTGEGFRFLEIVSQCPTYVHPGGKRSGAEILELFRDISAPLGEGRRAGKGARLLVGTLVDRRRPGYMRAMLDMERRVLMEAEEKRGVEGPADTGGPKAMGRRRERSRIGGGGGAEDEGRGLRGPGIGGGEEMEGADWARQSARAEGGQLPVERGKLRIRFSGFGGQGIVLMGVALGRAAAMAGLSALQTQSYGAEARGGACHSTVIISEGRISEIEPEELDVLVAMSQPARDRFIGMLRPGGTLLYDADLVGVERGPGLEEAWGGERGLRKGKKAKTAPAERAVAKGIPATALAKRALGRELYANSVMLGFFIRETGMVAAELARQALSLTVPKGTEGENLRALEVGLGYSAGE